MIHKVIHVMHATSQLSLEAPDGTFIKKGLRSVHFLDFKRNRDANQSGRRQGKGEPGAGVRPA
jgi:hypothetical protein